MKEMGIKLSLTVGVTLKSVSIIKSVNLTNESDLVLSHHQQRLMDWETFCASLVWPLDAPLLPLGLTCFSHLLSLHFVQTRSLALLPLSGNLACCSQNTLPPFKRRIYSPSSTSAHFNNMFRLSPSFCLCSFGSPQPANGA